MLFADSVDLHKPCKLNFLYSVKPSVVRVRQARALGVVHIAHNAELKRGFKLYLGLAAVVFYLAAEYSAGVKLILFAECNARCFGVDIVQNSGEHSRGNSGVDARNVVNLVAFKLSYRVYNRLENVGDINERVFSV